MSKYKYPVKISFMNIGPIILFPGIPAHKLSMGCDLLEKHLGRLESPLYLKFWLLTNSFDEKAASSLEQILIIKLGSSVINNVSKL